MWKDVNLLHHPENIEYSHFTTEYFVMVIHYPTSITMVCSPPHRLSIIIWALIATLSSTKLNPSSTYLGLEQFVPWKGMKWVERHFGITSHPRVNLYIHQRQAVTRIRFQQFAEQLFQFYNKVTRVKGTICSYSYSFLSQW